MHMHVHMHVCAYTRTLRYRENTAKMLTLVFSRQQDYRFLLMHFWIFYNIHDFKIFLVFFLFSKKCWSMGEKADPKVGQEVVNMFRGQSTCFP